MRRVLTGRTKIRIDIPKAMRFGSKALVGTPFGMRLDQVRLPRLYSRGPIMMTWETALLMKSELGTGLL